MGHVAAVNCPKLRVSTVHDGELERRLKTVFLHQPYEMADSSTLPFAEIPRGPIEAAARTAMDYSVSLIHDMRQIGSGTLVEVDGSFGILTAHHVADLFAAPDSTPLGLNIALEPHAFFLPRPTLQIVTIGKAANVQSSDDYTEHGPDLAFVCISDLNHLGTIKSKKSFCPLKRRPFAPYADYPLHELVWLLPIRITGFRGRLAGEEP